MVICIDQSCHELSRHLNADDFRFIKQQKCGTERLFIYSLPSTPLKCSFVNKKNLEPRSFAAMQHDMYMLHADSYTEKKPRWMFSI